jgi:hypothetical protein
MANIIQIWLKIEGCEIEIDSLFQRMKSDCSVWDFRCLIPLPIYTPYDRGWCINNWGSESNALASERLAPDTVYFETGNSLPTIAIQKLVSTYPNLRFTIEWIEERLENVGRWILKGKECLFLEEEYYFDWESKAPNSLIHLLNLKHQPDSYINFLKECIDDGTITDSANYYLGLIDS